MDIERLAIAVETLVGSGRIQDRLARAVLTVSPLQAVLDLPVALRLQFTQWMDDATSMPVERISDEQAERLAHELFAIYRQVRSEQGEDR